MHHPRYLRWGFMALAVFLVAGCNLSSHMHCGLAEFPIESIIREHAKDAPFGMSGGSNGGPNGYTRTFDISFKFADSEESLLLKALKDRTLQKILNKGGAIEGQGSDVRSFHWTYRCKGVRSGMISIWGIPLDDLGYRIIGVIFQR